MTIAQVSKQFGLTQDTLRYYERIGLIPRVERTSGGIRNYKEEDLQWIEFTKCMRSAGLPIDALIEYFALFQQGSSSAGARKALLVNQREQLAARITEMQQTLERLDAKIEHYDQTVASKEKKLAVQRGA